MRKILPILSLLVFTMPQEAVAQRIQGMEIFGGYAYLRDNLSSTYSPFYLSPTRFGSDFPLNGWQASVTENATDWLGLTQEFGGFYGTERLQGLDNHFSMFSILSGPRFSYPRLKGVTPFAHALFGYEQTKLSLPGSNLSVTSTSYAMALGGGMDVKVSRHMAIRLFQADYFLTRDFGSSQNNLRFSAGVVFRFGGRR
jgi:opacity protein-like surface antigen